MTTWTASTRDGWQIAILGGGPGGYEAALVARQLGADVVLIEAQGCGGNAVLTDVVPSKTVIAAAEAMTAIHDDTGLGKFLPASSEGTVDFVGLNARVKALAFAQSQDVEARLRADGVRIIKGRGRLTGPNQLHVESAEGEETINADIVLIAVGASPRELPSAPPDGERILTWKHLYDLPETPQRLIVVGSGVTGAEFAGAYDALGIDVVLVSSRDQVLPGEDSDAAEVIETVFRRRGMQIINKVRAQAAVNTGASVVVTLSDGRTVEGSHCLMAVGAVPNTKDIGLEAAGVQVSDGGYIQVDRVSRTSCPSIYAAGDCTGVLPLASVAAMQGRIAMWHALGDAVQPLRLETVCANVFTAPEIATVGVTQVQVESGQVEADVVKLPLATNARAKMQGLTDGFVKLFARPRTGIVVGGVVVAPRASELIFPLTLAVEHRLTVDDVAHAITVYPSLSGSLAEAARRLHHRQ